MLEFVVSTLETYYTLSVAVSHQRSRLDVCEKRRRVQRGQLARSFVLEHVVED